MFNIHNCRYIQIYYFCKAHCAACWTTIYPKIKNSSNLVCRATAAACRGICKRRHYLCPVWPLTSQENDSLSSQNPFPHNMKLPSSTNRLSGRLMNWGVRFPRKPWTIFDSSSPGELHWVLSGFPRLLLCVNVLYWNIYINVMWETWGGYQENHPNQTLRPETDFLSHSVRKMGFHTLIFKVNKISSWDLIL